MQHMTRDLNAAIPAPADEARFAFGANWARFLGTVDDRRITEAERSLVGYLGEQGTREQDVLDLGSGSGLFSLAACRLGARRLVSVDFDPQSVACTTELRRRFGPAGADWTIARADATDADEMAALGQFDLVYSWGVLHHTGRLWDAMGLACAAVRPSGRLFISIYNDQGYKSRMWLGVKRRYNRTPERLRPLYVALAMAPRELAFFVLGLRGRPLSYYRVWRNYAENRGMSRWHDLVDWTGGLPFEVAHPDEVFDFCRQRGFTLERLTTTGGGLGCNQFVFRRD